VRRVLKEAVDLAISPMDIHHKEFSTVRMGGYNKEEVDSFLDMVADELDRLLHRNQEQAELMESMRQKAAQFDNMQTTLQNALINAQKSADSIVQDARSQAEAQIKEASQQRDKIMEEASTERVRISQSFTGIREQVLRYIATIRELLDKNQDLVKEYESRLSASELKEQPMPSVAAVPPEPSPSQPSAAPMEREGEALKASAPVTQETGQSGPEVLTYPSAAGVEEPSPDRMAAPSFPELEGPSATPETPSFAPIAETPKEPVPMGFESEKTTPLEEQAPPMTGQPSGPSFTAEQEIEMMRESTNTEKETPVPQPPEKPSEETEGEEEKHFFWE
jgi:cell division initiation protein